MRIYQLHLAGSAALALLLSSCAQLDPLASGDIAAGARSAGTVSTEQVLRPGSAAAIEKVLRNTQPDSDRSAAITTEAERVIAWLGIARGMQVLDLYADGGRYTAILSDLVGESGRVVVHDNTPYVDFVRAGTPPVEIRVDNVQRLRSTPDTLVLPARGFDAALLFMDYRNVYYVIGPEGWKKLEDDNLLTALYRSLRPGAVLGVIQHRRIDPAGGIAESSEQQPDPAQTRIALTAAGFVFEAEQHFGGESSDADPSAGKRRLAQRFRRPW